MNKIALRIHFGVHDWTAKRAIIASNVRTGSLFSSTVGHSQSSR